MVRRDVEPKIFLMAPALERNCFCLTVPAPALECNFNHKSKTKKQTLGNKIFIELRKMISS